MDGLNMAIVTIGSIGFAPLALAIIGSLRAAVKRSRREAMLHRHWRNHL
jgi:hypothetical protein